jgi:hypothetical protein
MLPETERMNRMTIAYTGISKDLLKAKGNLHNFIQVCLESDDGCQGFFIPFEDKFSAKEILSEVSEIKKELNQEKPIDQIVVVGKKMGKNFNEYFDAVCSGMSPDSVEKKELIVIYGESKKSIVIKHTEIIRDYLHNIVDFGKTETIILDGNKHTFHTMFGL